MKILYVNGARQSVFIAQNILITCPSDIKCCNVLTPHDEFTIWKREFLSNDFVYEYHLDEYPHDTLLKIDERKYYFYTNGQYGHLTDSTGYILPAKLMNLTVYNLKNFDIIYTKNELENIHLQLEIFQKQFEYRYQNNEVINDIDVIETFHRIVELRNNLEHYFAIEDEEVKNYLKIML